jgi:hypothetical protein
VESLKKASARVSEVGEIVYEAQHGALVHAMVVRSVFSPGIIVFGSESNRG